MRDLLTNNAVTRYLSRHQLQRDTLFGFGATALRGAATVLSSYFVVRSLGLELLGSWTFLLLLTSQGYLGLIDLGLHSPVTRQMALAANSGRMHGVDGLKNWYARRLAIHVAIAGPLVAALFLLISPEEVSLSLSSGLAIVSLVLLLVADTALLPTFACLEATSRFLALRSLEVAQRILLLGFIVIFVMNRPSLTSMLLSYLLTSFIVLTVAMWTTRSKASTGASDLTSSSGGSESILDLVPPTKQMTSSLAARIATTAQWQIGRTLILISVGITAAGELEVVTRFVAVLTLLMSALTGALLPRFVNAEHSPDQLKSVLNIATKWFLFIVVPLIVFLLMSTEQILELWFGEQYIGIAYPTRLMLLAQFLVGLTAIFDLVLVSLNRNEFFAFSRWMAVVTTALISIPLIAKFELNGLLYGVLGASLISMVTSLFLLQRASGVVARLDLWSVFRPPLIVVGLLVCGSFPLIVILSDSTNLTLSLILRSLVLGLSYIVAMTFIPSLKLTLFTRSGVPKNGG